MRPRRPGARHLRLQDDPPWDASAYLNTPDSAPPHFVKKANQADNLVAHNEVRQRDLWSRPFVRVELHVFQRHRPRIEYGLGMSDLQVFDAAVFDGLEVRHSEPVFD